MKNPTSLQCFYQYYPTGDKLWHEAETLAPSLDEIGINMIWLPPAYKGALGGYSVGYSTYDLLDLDEFDQKSSVTTKYGGKVQSLAAMKTLKGHDITMLLDVVVNHKMGTDEEETPQMQRVDKHDRTQITEEIIECEVWTRYTSPVRAGQYS